MHIYNSSDRDNRVQYCHYITNLSRNYIHLKLRGNHFTPLLPTGEQKPENFDNDLRVDDPNESIKKSNDTDFTPEDLMDYTDCAEESPEYVREPDEVPPKPPDTDSAHCNIESPQLPEAYYKPSYNMQRRAAKDHGRRIKYRQKYNMRHDDKHAHFETRLKGIYFKNFKVCPETGKWHYVS